MFSVDLTADANYSQSEYNGQLVAVSTLDVFMLFTFPHYTTYTIPNPICIFSCPLLCVTGLPFCFVCTPKPKL